MSLVEFLDCLSEQRGQFDIIYRNGVPGFIRAKEDLLCPICTVADSILWSEGDYVLDGAELGLSYQNVQAIARASDGEPGALRNKLLSTLGLEEATA
jgi:hypothetical protein